MVYPGNCNICGSLLVFKAQGRSGNLMFQCPQCDVNPYLTKCWECHCKVDSRDCKPSQIPGMAYHCKHCGYDLSWWKVKKKLLKVDQLRQMEMYYCGTCTSVPESMRYRERRF